MSCVLFCLAMQQLRTTLSGNPTVKACTVAGCALLLSNGAKSVQPTSSRHGRLGRLMDMTSKRIEMEWSESPDRENKPEEDTNKTKIAGVIELRTSTDTGLVHLHGSTCCGMEKLAVQQESCSDDFRGWASVQRWDENLNLELTRASNNLFNENCNCSKLSIRVYVYIHVPV